MMLESYSAADYFKDLVIPDTWNTLEDFVNWYMNARMPLMVPWNKGVVRTDDSTSICIFKKGQFQLEMYLIYPNMDVPRHAHPGVEIITMTMGGGSIWPEGVLGTSEVGWGKVEPLLRPGQFHGGNWTKHSSGWCLLSFEKWPEGMEPASAAIQWKGSTAGPIQEKLIRDNVPDAFIIPGYADISRKK